MTWSAGKAKYNAAQVLQAYKKEPTREKERAYEPTKIDFYKAYDQAYGAYNQANQASTKSRCLPQPSTPFYRRLQQINCFNWLSLWQPHFHQK